MKDSEIKKHLDMDYPYGKEIYELLNDVVVTVGSNTRNLGGTGTEVIPKGTLCNITKANDGTVWVEWDFLVNCKNNLCEKHRGKNPTNLNHIYLGRYNANLNICEKEDCIFCK